MPQLFEHFQGYDVQATRKEARAEGKREGVTEGNLQQRISLVCKKVLKENR